MTNAEQLCNTIKSLYPEVGTCGIDINIEKDKSQDAWLIHMDKDSHHLDHFLELEHADNCVEGKECISLALEIAQLQKNIDGKQF